MKYLSVCSGIEAATVAWEPLGWEPVAFSEIEAFPSAVLKHHYPTVSNLGDMTKIHGGDVDAADVLVGGSPCQSFSPAGLRRGLQDERGNLALQFMRIAGELRPKWAIWENVPGVLRTNGGRDFGAILGALVELGYGVAYRILDAQFFGVPQRRRRVFVVGCLGDWAAPVEVLFDAAGRGGGNATACEEGSIDACGREGDCEHQSVGGWWDGRRVSQTIDAVLYKKQCLPEKNRFPAVLVPAWVRCECCEDFICQAHGCHAHECECKSIERWAEADESPYAPCLLRYVTPRECERLMGFPDDYTLIPGASDSQRYRALGNSFAVPVVRWIGRRIHKATRPPT